MGTPRTTLYAATAAFAAGIGMTAALMTLNAGGSSIISQATQPGVPSGPSRTAERPWSEPSKPTVSSAPASREAQPSLRFDVAQEAGKIDTAPAKSSSTLPADVQASHQQDRSSPAIDDSIKRALAEPRAPGRTAPTQASIALTPSMQARLDTIRVERAASERARPDRSKFVRVERNASEIVRPAVTRNRLPEIPRNTVVDQDLPRERLVRRLVAKAPLGERQSLAASKDVRSIVTPTRRFTYADSQRLEARDPRKRVSSADAGGVMKWLMEPSSNF